MLIAAIEGMFDAVSLLALPSVIVLGAAGALIPSGPAPARAARGPRGRSYLTAIAATAWLAFVAMTAARIEAMRLYTEGTLAAAQAAALLDPGSYRVQMRAAELEVTRGSCHQAYHNASNARDLFPHAIAPRAIIARCAGSGR